MKHYDVIVLGSGIAGLSVAMALARAKKKVLIIHRNRLKGEASPAAAGILDPLLDLAPNSPLLKFRCEAFRRYPAFLKKLQGTIKQDLGYKKTGMLYTAVTAAEERRLFKQYRWQKKMGIPIRVLDQKKTLKVAPLLTKKIRSSLHYPSVGRLQASKLIQAMKKAARKMKIEFVRGSDTLSLWTEGNSVKGIRIGKHKFCAATVVNALGSWSGAYQTLGIKPPVVPARGQVLILRGKEVSNQVLYSSDGTYLVPWGKNLCLLGSTVEYVGFRPQVTHAGLRQIRRKIQRILPDIDKLKVEKSWAGLRPRSKDKLPLIGATRIKGLFMATGFFRSGILIGAYAGDLLAQVILTGRTPKALRPFNPKRFP